MAQSTIALNTHTFSPEELIEDLIRRQTLRKNGLVIGIAGAGCIGKTTFALKFIQTLGSDRCETISLDGYMLERRVREPLGLTGYNPQGFELLRAGKEIEGLIKTRTPFVLHEYNRRTHERDSSRHIEAKPVLLIEGSMALRDELIDFIDYPIFFETSQRVQYQLRLKREGKEFHYNETQVKERFLRYYHDYQEYILPQKKRARMIVRVDQNYQFSFIHG